MDFPATLQSRAPTAYFPPHSTQLHPRMRSSSSSSSSPSQNPKHNNNNNKCLILTASLFTIPFFFYLFTTAHKIHRSPKFSEPNPKSFGVIVHSGSAGSRVCVFELLGEGQMPFVDSMKVRSGLAENVGGQMMELVEFAKRRVPKKEWGNCKVQLMVDAGEIERLEVEVRDMVLDECRRLLRESGFAFRDEWARVIQGEEVGVYAWVAVNYALGTLGEEPEKTTGIVELGGASLQVTFVPSEPSQVRSLRIIKLAGVTYNLYSQSLPHLGQDAAWELLHELHNSRELTSLANSSEGIVGNPCIPKGYELASNLSDAKFLMSHPAGNFSACRFEVLALLKRRHDKCLRPPCKIVSPLSLELQGKPVSPENFSYASEFFGLVPRASLFELEAAGQHYCEDNWDKQKNQHHSADDMDLLRYCFSSAYTVALLHDSLGIPMNYKRIGFANHTGNIPLDWTLGAFVFQSLQEPLEFELDNLNQIVGYESGTYFLLFAFLLIAMLAAFFVLQWRKPKLKTIYDLQKGHYIVTRV